MGKPNRSQPYTENYRQLRNPESGRNSVPQERAHPLALQYQTVSPDNKSDVTVWVGYTGYKFIPDHLEAPHSRSSRWTVQCP